MSVFRVFLVRIFPHSDWIRRDTQSECEKMRIRITPNTDIFYVVMFLIILRLVLKFLEIVRTQWELFSKTSNKGPIYSKLFEKIMLLLKYILETLNIIMYLSFWLLVKWFVVLRSITWNIGKSYIPGYFLKTVSKVIFTVMSTIAMSLIWISESVLSFAIGSNGVFFGLNAGK